MNAQPKGKLEDQLNFEHLQALEKIFRVSYFMNFDKITIAYNLYYGIHVFFYCHINEALANGTLLRVSWSTNNIINLFFQYH